MFSLSPVLTSKESYLLRHRRWRGLFHVHIYHVPLSSPSSSGQDLDPETVGSRWFRPEVSRCHLGSSWVVLVYRLRLRLVVDTNSPISMYGPIGSSSVIGSDTFPEPMVRHRGKGPMFKNPGITMFYFISESPFKVYSSKKDSVILFTYGGVSLVPLLSRISRIYRSPTHDPSLN